MRLVTYDPLQSSYRYGRINSKAIYIRTNPDLFVVTENIQSENTENSGKLTVVMVGSDRGGGGAEGN